VARATVAMDVMTDEQRRELDRRRQEHQRNPTTALC
jgi:hypothetical protein